MKTTEEQRAYHREWYRKHKTNGAWRDTGDMRKCTRCKQSKTRAESFPKLRHGRIGYAAMCKACKNELRRGAAPSWTGLTRAQYQKHVREAACHICGNNKPRMAVDHCHVTLKKRGVLCMDCNVGLGRFRDNPETLERAAAYLRGKIVHKISDFPNC